MSTPELAKARELARELLERETAGATEVTRFGSALQRACTRVSDNLRRSVGEDGYSALFARAVARTECDQPVLTDIRSNAAGAHLDVVTAVQRHGTATVGAAVESLLAALLDILSDLIGADMARSLLDHDDSPRAPAARARQ